MPYGKPITPAEVVSRKADTIPAPVFEAFNECIAKYWDGRVATFDQVDVVKLILEKYKGTTPSDIDSGGWLNIEDCYREVGWAVEYDKPGFNETHRATFTFKKRRGS